MTEVPYRRFPGREDDPRYFKNLDATDEPPSPWLATVTVTGTSQEVMHALIVQALRDAGLDGTVQLEEPPWEEVP